MPGRTVQLEKEIISSIKILMRRNNIGYRELAEKTGIKRSRINRILNIHSDQHLSIKDANEIYNALGSDLRSELTRTTREIIRNELIDFMEKKLN